MKPRALFEDSGDGIFKGKGISSLRKSAVGRMELIAMFGGLRNLPSSIMKMDRSAGVTAEEDLHVVERGYSATSPGREKAKDDKIPKSLRQAYAISGRGCGAGALSRFPQNIGRSMVMLYSDPGDIVFDPFAGHNSRMDLVVKAGRHYIGCDLSTEFMRFNFKRADVLRSRYKEARIDLHHVDSRKVPVKSDIANMTISSPPYFDIEYYGDEPEQLGKSDTYEDFLTGMTKVAKENFRVLKSGSYACWFVNDFRRKGKFYLYHVDTIRLMESVGFVTQDIVIVDLGRTMRDAFTNQIIEQKIIPKRHEYCLVFKKS